MIDWSQLVTPADVRQDMLASALALVRQTRTSLLTVLDGVQASALALGNQADALAVEGVKQGLRDLPNLDLSECATHEDVKLKVKQAYLSLIAGAPASAVKAFRDYAA